MPFTMEYKNEADKENYDMNCKEIKDYTDQPISTDMPTMEKHAYDEVDASPKTAIIIQQQGNMILLLQ